MELTQARVRELFDYCDDGRLLWKIRTSNRIAVGDPAGALTQWGYLMAGILGQKVFVHRVVFLYHHGYIPKSVDHINGVRTDNRIENLRPATSTENNRNRVIHKNNACGFKGVYLDKRRNNWVASITIGYKAKFLGSFGTPEEAHAAYLKAASLKFGEFARAS